MVVCTFTYLLIGAAVFDSLESETEHKRGKFLEGECWPIKNYFSINFYCETNNSFSIRGKGQSEKEIQNYRGGLQNGGSGYNWKQAP